ncbi:hypothetical protein ACNQVK_02390 [Mycobacterium sp. 134]|uniref:hypothetical protein n=1 Tax=Mycobacterium sp. 134 TaxID=3400425 RepID=UPI003AAC05AA
MSARQYDVAEREQAIIRYLRNLDDPGVGATVPQIHRTLTETGTHFPTADEPIRDTVSLPVYYKIVRRMTAIGHLEERPSSATGDGVRYTLADALHADTALTLADIDEMVHAQRPTEVIAALVDAREYIQGKRDTVLRDAAIALRGVDPRRLVEDLVLDLVAAYNADVDICADGDATDIAHHHRIRDQRLTLDTFCYARLGLTRQAITIPSSATVASPNGDPAQRIDVHPAVLRAELRRRIYGTTAISLIHPGAAIEPVDWINATVSGSDGSTYSSVMQIDTGAKFVDAAGAEVITFNNSVVYLELPKGAKRPRSPLYSVPLTRSAIDNPINGGMVMAPFMYRSEGLTDSSYEHMAKCATDVVQWRADERVFTGHGKSLGAGEELPTPRVHFRDGTVTLQERWSNHYQFANSYGAMVREGVRLSHDVLRHIRDRRNPPVFAGAVKSSQLDLFATIVNWFIKHGHPASDVAPIDPGWDVARGSHLSDNELMNYLLGAIEVDRRDGYFVSFVVARPFHALTDLYRQCNSDDPDSWTEMFRRRQHEHRADETMESYWKNVEDIDDDPYIRMLHYADYGLFYIGHSSGDPGPLAPRYEFLESLRPMDESEAADRVRRNVEMIVGALDHVGFTLDRDHNFLSKKILVKILPSVVYNAHENCKALGRILERELKSMVLDNLKRLRGSRTPSVDRVAYFPDSVQQFIKRWSDAQPQDAADVLPSASDRHGPQALP